MIRSLKEAPWSVKGGFLHLNQIQWVPKLQALTSTFGYLGDF